MGDLNNPNSTSIFSSPLLAVTIKSGLWPFLNTLAFDNLFALLQKTSKNKVNIANTPEYSSENYQLTVFPGISGKKGLKMGCIE